MPGLMLVPTNLTPSSGPAVGDITELPEEVRLTVEEAWTYFSKPDTPDEMALTVNLGDKVAKAKWVAQAQAYCANRSQLGNGAVDLYLRVSPVRANKETGVATFRIRTAADQEKRAAEAQAIRDAESQKGSKK